jgi:hypothetical protein
MTTDKEQLREAAVQLIAAVWSRVDWDGVSAKWRMGIWEEFGSKIQSAAMTSDAHRFVEALARKMDVRSLNSDTVPFVLSTCDHDALLDLIRNETTLLVLMLRLRQEEKRESRKAAAGLPRKGTDVQQFFPELSFDKAEA